jgi:putative aldouronate transport system substrate-binding protein
LRNSYKKTSSLIVIAVLLFSLVLSACAKNNAPASGSNQSGATPSNSASAKPKSQITVSMYDRGNIPPEVGTTENNLWTKWINEKMAVKYIPVPRWEAVAKYNSLLAAGDAPNLILEYDEKFRNQLYVQKQIVSIDDMIEQYSTDYKQLLEQFPLLRTLGTKSDGKLYEFGRVLGYIPGTFLFIREDWLEKLKLEVPHTAEEALAVMSAFATQDPDNNGKADTFGTNLSGYAWVDVMFQNTGLIIQNGGIVKDWERVAATTDYKKQLFDKGLVDKDFLTDSKGEKSLQDFLQGKTGIYGYMGNVLQVYNNYETLKKSDPNAKLKVIAIPSSQFGQFSPAFNPPIQMTGVVNVNTKDQEAVMNYVDFMSSESTAHTLKYGLEGEHYKLENGKEVTLDKDKYDKEVSWLGDFRMLGGQHIINEYTKYMDDLDQTKPLDKEVYEMLKAAYNLYISKERPIGNFTIYMPGVPDDIQFIASNADTPVADIWVKAIVSGSSYSVAKAAEDAKTLWKKSDGDKLEQWYADWYAENKDTWVFTEDLYDMKF